MTDQEQPKIEVKVSANVTAPFWTAGWLYTLGAMLAGPENMALLEGLSWYELLGAFVGSYLTWPFLLGFGTWIGQ